MAPFGEINSGYDCRVLADQRPSLSKRCSVRSEAIVNGRCSTRDAGDDHPFSERLSAFEPVVDRFGFGVDLQPGVLEQAP